MSEDFGSTEAEPDKPLCDHLVADTILKLLGHDGGSDAYDNLAGALYDLKRQDADKVCIRTIERVQGQIAAVFKYAKEVG